MTNLKELMDAATPHEDGSVSTTAEDAAKDMMYAAAPLVLEYMKGGHHDTCLWWQAFDGERGECTCGYSALAKSLGVEHEV